MSEAAPDLFVPLFADARTLILGALTGFVFGFLLQRGGVLRYQTILAQFLLRDFTVLKVMGTAIVVGAIGIYAMRALGAEFPMHIKNAVLLGNIVGGLIFGVGMAILGFCPGTAVAAIGDGSRHAIPGVLGGLVGAALFAEAYPWVKQRLLKPVDLGKATIDSQIGLSPWWVIGAMALVAFVGFLLLERRERRLRPGSA